MSGKLSPEEDPNPKKLQTTGEKSGPEKFMVPAPEGINPMPGKQALEALRRLRELVGDEDTLGYYTNVWTGDDQLKVARNGLDDELKPIAPRVNDRLKVGPPFKSAPKQSGEWIVYNETTGDRFEVPSAARAQNLRRLLNDTHESLVRVISTGRQDGKGRNYEVRYAASFVAIYFTHSERNALRLQELINRNVRRE